MSRYAWSQLNGQQVGAYTEYFFKMELTMFGFQVYGTEVDDRGIDFVARYEDGPFLVVQVKSLRVRREAPTGYVFVPKAKFVLQENLYLALGLLFEGEHPELFLIPSLVWTQPTRIFVSRDYEGLKSPPEWGLSITRRYSPTLEPYRLEIVLGNLIGQSKSKGTLPTI